MAASGDAGRDRWLGVASGFVDRQQRIGRAGWPRPRRRTDGREVRRRLRVAAVARYPVGLVSDEPAQPNDGVSYIRPHTLDAPECQPVLALPGG